MSVYFIANIKMDDEKEYNKYIQKSSEVFNQYSGRYITVDDNPIILEGEWKYSRVVIIEFPCQEMFDAWYYSDAYQEILKHRLSGAKCDTILVTSGKWGK